MSEEMAVLDKIESEVGNASNVNSTPQTGDVAEESPGDQSTDSSDQQIGEPIPSLNDAPPTVKVELPEPKEYLETPEEFLAKMESDTFPPEIKTELYVEEAGENEDSTTPLDDIKMVDIKVEDFSEDDTKDLQVEEEYRGIKRKASVAFSDDGDNQFKGFDSIETAPFEDYNKILEKLEAEVTAASKEFVPVRHVMGNPGVAVASKRLRTDTDSSRPSSAMSSRSDDAGTDASAASSPASRRRATTEMSSPLLRVPLERGWRRELVYRAALDAHQRRNADIYYYMPSGKKLRSTREIAEHLSGTGLTLENFSFFKEPLGINDPEKEIIRDAKLMRRNESPVAAFAPAPVSAVVEGKRIPKPKPPKGASPEPQMKLPPAKIKVKSVGSRLSSNGPPAVSSPAPVVTKQKKMQQQPVITNADNNNSATWKKPRPPVQSPQCGPHAPLGPLGLHAPQAGPAQPAAQGALPSLPTQPPSLQGRSAPLQSLPGTQPTRQLVQPCSMACGRGTVPSLSCAACLCLYHPACAGYLHNLPPSPFLCKNCRKTSSPPLDSPTLMQKSGVGVAGGIVATPPLPPPALSRRGAAASAQAAAQAPMASPATSATTAPRSTGPAPAKHTKDNKRVLLRMKVAGSGAEGERVWSVAGPPRATPTLPQSIAVVNGRRFIVVPRAMANPPAQAHQHSITAAECD